MESNKGSVHILKQKQTTGIPECQQLAYLDDGSSARITADPSQSAVDQSGNAKPGVDICDAADKATDATATALSSGKAKTISFTQGSLGNIDICSLLSVQDASSILSTSGLSSVSSKTKHKCGWQKPNDTNGTSAGLIISANLEPKPVQADMFGGQMVKIAGRDTVVYSLDDPGSATATCTAETAGKTWRPWPGIQQPANDSLIEYANIFVLVPGGSKDQACQEAQSAAAKAWTQLPTS